MVSRRRIWVRRSIALAFLVLLAGAAAGVAVALLTPADEPPTPDAGAIYQRGLTADGWPWLAGVPQETGAKGRAWQRCTPECGEVESEAEFFRPGRTAPGTFFTMTAPDGEVVYADRTPIWQGQVKNTKPPKLDGQAVVGATVTPRRGRWTGGWPDDGSTVGVRACRTAKGEGCVAISRSLVHGAGRQTSVEIGPVYVGWYVGAVERRTGGVETVTMEAVPPPRGDKISRYPSPTPSQTAAMGALRGPVKAAPVAAAATPTTPTG